jgi:hypothetical protein
MKVVIHLIFHSLPNGFWLPRAFSIDILLFTGTRVYPFLGITTMTVYLFKDKRRNCSVMEKENLQFLEIFF